MERVLMGWHSALIPVHESQAWQGLPSYTGELGCPVIAHLYPASDINPHKHLKINGKAAVLQSQSLKDKGFSLKRIMEVNAHWFIYFILTWCFLLQR